MKVLIIDNYDSFTFNLYQLVGEILEEKFIGSTLDVYRNNKISIKELKNNQYDRIIISPGPGNPANTKYFGICKEVILDIATKIPTLGVCLGMQGLAHYYGGSITKSKTPMHGKISQISHQNDSIFKDIPTNINVMRYHSLVIDPLSVPPSLQVIATASTRKNQSEIMALKHKNYPLVGVQFHPESFATEYGKELLINFLRNII